MLACAAVLVLAMSGCSSPGPTEADSREPADADSKGSVQAGDSGPNQDAVMSSVLEQLESMGIDPDSGEAVGDDIADDDDSGDAGPVQQDAPPITRFLPAEPVGDPAGWQRSPVQCLDRAEAIGSSYVSFAVPAEWELGGKSGGSGSPRGMSFDYRFRPANLGQVTIAIDSDSRDADGVLQKEYDGQPDSESTFDYDYSVDSDKVRITFDSIGELPVGEGTTELFVARPEQAPDRLKDVVYKARIDQIAVPQPMFDGSWSTWASTFVVELSYRPDEGEVPEDTVKSIVSSLVMPECSVTNAIVLVELNSQRDVDGDGHIADQQDFMDALQMGG